MVKSKPYQQIGQTCFGDSLSASARVGFSRVGYILRSYPRLSQTFILNEILALEQAGASIQIFAVTNPHEDKIQPEVHQVQALVRYLESAGSAFKRVPLPLRRILRFWSVFLEHLLTLLANPSGYMTSLWYVLCHREIDDGYTSANRMHCFYLAMVLSRMLRVDRHAGRPTIDHLHAHFAHDPALIAQVTHRLTGLPFSFTAHARDLFQVSPTALLDRIREAHSVVTCCRANLDYLLQVAPSEQEKFQMVYHGVDLHRFHPASHPEPSAEIPLVLSVGRLIEKKGFFDLLRALECVRESGLPFRCQIYGDGPLRPALQQWIDEHGLAEQVTLPGSLPQKQLIPVYQSAALFVLTPHITADGDRDGIPNVLVEAMAAGIPVVSTSLSGIPELVFHGHNGLLYDPGDIQAISGGIARLLSDPSVRAAYGRSARRHVARYFNIYQAAAQLQGIFNLLPSTVDQVPPYPGNQASSSAVSLPTMIPVTARPRRRPLSVDKFFHHASPYE